MVKKTPVLPEDLRVFQQAMQGTRVLSSDKIRLAPKQAPTRPPVRAESRPEQFGLPEVDSEQYSVASDTFIFYQQNGVANKTLRKLRKGQYNVEARLDLHGMIIETARRAVDLFLQDCILNEIRVALIIHGKGLPGQMPALKNNLIQWLRHAHVVLAFCSAQPAHGGQGATYVMLKRTTEERT